MSLATSVVLIIYNRPGLTERVFSAIAAARPSKLFIVGDGADVPEESQKCAHTRSIVNRVDWDCKVLANLSDHHLGCRRRIVSGLDWVFSQVDEAIILEDDCVPHPSFFNFCEILLERYRHDDRVMEIGGGNYQFGHQRSQHSYFFSKYSHTWGWATWKRAWQYFDESISFWPTLRESDLWSLICENKSEQNYWRPIYDKIFSGRITSTWDYQWQLARWCQSGLAIVPSLNLVSNIGFGRDATHTIWKCDTLSNLPAHDIGQIIHPPWVIRHREADKYLFHKIYRIDPLKKVIRVAKNYWCSSRAAH